MALSPMMQQYLQIHDQYPDCLLLFRLGDFYELFFEDAKTASRELELTLTGRDCGLEGIGVKGVLGQSLELVNDLLYGEPYELDAEVATHEGRVDVAGDEPVGRLADDAEALSPQARYGLFGFSEKGDAGADVGWRSVQDFALQPLLAEEGENLHSCSK